MTAPHLTAADLREIDAWLTHPDQQWQMPIGDAQHLLADLRTARAERDALAAALDEFTHEFDPDVNDPEGCNSYDSYDSVCFAARDAACHQTAAVVLAALTPTEKDPT